MRSVGVGRCQGREYGDSNDPMLPEYRRATTAAFAAEYDLLPGLPLGRYLFDGFLTARYPQV